MIIDISELFSTPNKKLHMQADLEMDQISVFGNTYPLIRKDPVSLTVMNTGPDAIRLTAEVSMVLSVPCDRCLTPVDVPAAFAVDRTVDYKSEDPEETQEREALFYLDHDTLDVDAMAAVELLPHFPMKTLCREDCKGLCIQCGANLNEGECGCDRFVPDVRMAGIQDIFDQFQR